MRGLSSSEWSELGTGDGTGDSKVETGEGTGDVREGTGDGVKEGTGDVMEGECGCGGGLIKDSEGELEVNIQDVTMMYGKWRVVGLKFHHEYLKDNMKLF